MEIQPLYNNKIIFVYQINYFLPAENEDPNPEPERIDGLNWKGRPIYKQIIIKSVI